MLTPNIPSYKCHKCMYTYRHTYVCKVCLRRRMNNVQKMLYENVLHGAEKNSKPANLTGNLGDSNASLFSLLVTGNRLQPRLTFSSQLTTRNVFDSVWRGLFMSF